ncbi:MAG: stalk domain-containing protein [Caldisericia bacterium]|nr:stalk domain-containing protein [Caldisericia bacterium]
MKNKFLLLCLCGLLVAHVFFLIPPTKGAIKEQVDYLIIAPPGLTTVLHPLIKHRQKQGLLTAYYETGEIFNQYVGTTKQDQIRNFLISKFESWNLRYVVLVGDEKTIPYETFYPFYPRDSGVYKYNTIQSDFFFCSLDSDLDVNQNGYTGEFIGDKNISFHAEVRVGRIPFQTPQEVSTIINRMIRTENKPPQKKALLSSTILNYAMEETEQMDFIDQRTDGASLTESIVQDLLKPLNYNTYRMGEKGGLQPSTYPAEYALKKKNFEFLLEKNSFDMVLWEGHGSHTELISKIWDKDKNSNRKVERKELVEETVLDINSFNTISQDHGLFISGCCSNLYPHDSNLGKMALLNGFSCFIGGTSVNWYSIDWRSLQNGGNQTLLYLIVRNITLRNQSYGDALYNAIEECWKKYSQLGSFDYANFYSFNLYGDPASRLNSSFGRNFSASLDEPYKTAILGENIYFTISVESAGFADSVSLYPGNYNTDLFQVSVYPETIPTPGEFIVKITPKPSIYPSTYTISFHLMSPFKSVFLCPRFTILPYGENQKAFLNFSQWHLQKNTHFTVDVIGKNLLNADSVFLELLFDPTFLEIQPNQYQYGSFFSQDGVIPKIRTSLQDNVLSITISRERKRIGMNGTGVLASVTFKTLKNGFSTLYLNKAIYMNPHQNSYSLETNNSRITISDLGLYIRPDIPLYEKTTKRSYFSQGQTNGNKIWFIEDQKEILLDKTGKNSFISHFSSHRRNNNLAWLVQKDNQFAQIRSFITFTNITEVHLWIDNYWAFINDEAMSLESPPIIYNNRTMVPLRFLADSLKVSIDWDAKTRKITLYQGDSKVILYIGKKEAIVEQNGISTTVTLDAPPMIMNSRTLVPLRFLSEVFRTTVEWNPTFKHISISYVTL